jgi:hypothetical protein
LSGTALSNLVNGIYNIGGSNRSTTFAGVVQSSATINKYGTGTLTLTNANLNTNTTTVNGGTLTVSNTTGSATGTGTVLVRSGAVLNGTGLITGGVTLESGATLNGNPTIGGAVTVRTGAFLSPGTPGSSLVKTVSINNNLTLQTRSYTTMKIFGGIVPTFDKLVVSGIFNPGGILTVVRPSQLAISDGFTYSLFAASSIGATRFDSLYLPDLGSTMYWDTTKLYVNGTLTARIVTSLKETDGNAFSLSENLVRNDVRVQTGNFQGKAGLQLLDAKGILLRETQVTANASVVIDLADYAPGVYFVRLKKERGSETKQLIKSAN